MNDDEKAMVAVLAKYQDAANKSDAEAVRALFAPDGVLMAENSDSAVGAEAVGQAYGAMANAIKLDIAFKVEEVRQLSPDWGFRRTGASRARIPPARSASSRPVRLCRNRTRSCSCSRRLRVTGGSRATASRRSCRHSRAEGARAGPIVKVHAGGE